MKQNLQTPATPLEMLSLFFPAGLLDYFDLVNHVSAQFENLGELVKNTIFVA